jgi:TorA-specific chaperone
MVEYSSSQVAVNRAALYHWLAMAFFAPPAASEIVDMCDGKTHHLLQALAATPDAGLGVTAMREVLTTDTPAVVASTLGAAYARLFLGVGAYEVAPPYRSVYSSIGGLLCQQATAEMERVLRQHRLRLQDKVKEPSDHLSIQLEVMAQLALRFAEVAEDPASNLIHLQQEQAEFLAGQLLCWLPTFVQRVIEVDDLGFYAGLASVLLRVLEQDLAYLDATLQETA